MVLLIHKYDWDGAYIGQALTSGPRTVAQSDGKGGQSMVAFPDEAPCFQFGRAFKSKLDGFKPEGCGNTGDYRGRSFKILRRFWALSRQMDQKASILVRTVARIYARDPETPSELSS
jgi:hypothetical protein